MTISKQDRGYGRLVVDFVNLATTDEVGLKYFRNIQQVFGFTSGFIDKAKVQFPTFDNFNNLMNDVEKQCFELILKKINIELDILAAIHGDFLYYDIYSKKIRIEESVTPHSRDGLCIGKTEHKEKIISVKKLKEMIEKGRADSGYKLKKTDALNNLPILEKMSEKILALKGISKIRYYEILEYEEYYRNLNIEHWKIENTQKLLKKLLNDIIQGNSLSDNKNLKNILLIYNKIPKTKVIMSNTGAIRDNLHFSEAFFLDRKNRSVYEYTSQVYDWPISYCLVEYLRDQTNIKYLKICRQCDRFFIAADTRRQFCNEPNNCKKIHFNKYRTKRMKDVYRNPASDKFKINYIC